MSVAHLGKKMPEKTRLAIKNADHSHTPESRRKLREAALRRYAVPEARAKLLDHLQRLRNSGALKGYLRSEENIEKLRISKCLRQLQFWLHPEER